MCDTLGFIQNGCAVFAKNSDRSPNEPQVLEFYPAAHPAEKTLKATYIQIPQVSETHAVLLSRPTWLWGAEIGVNDCGVCIGNEAVWTLGKYGDPALTGMDLVRLGLERASSAKEATLVITELLETYGQGGNCGYDHDFYYDNSFLVMDRDELYVLETAGKKWVFKKMDRRSISNRLSLGSDGDRYSSSGKAYNFKLRHTEHLYNIASGSFGRKKLTGTCLEKAENVKDMMAALRVHNGDMDPFARGTVNSPCMHFGGLVGDHTTASMVVDLKADRTVVWATGTSCPCVSLFKPWIFGSEIAPVKVTDTAYWYEQEKFRRSLLGKKLPAAFYEERDALEDRWLSEVEALSAVHADHADHADHAAFKALTERCFEEEKAFFEKWSAKEFETVKTSAGFAARWAKKTRILTNESK